MLLTSWSSLQAFGCFEKDHTSGPELDGKENHELRVDDSSRGMGGG
jgi:hypothetical protein